MFVHLAESDNYTNIFYATTGRLAEGTIFSWQKKVLYLAEADIFNFNL